MKVRQFAVLALAALLGPTALAAQVCTEWSLEETLRIGSIDGDDALAGVLDLSVGPDGRVYLAEQFVPAVAVFGADGKRESRIGRAGSGPGEFEGWPSRLGWMGDTLWVSDRSGLTLFGPDRELLRRVQFRALRPTEGSALSPSRPLSDGSYLPKRIATTAAGGTMAPFFASERLPALRLSAEGEVLGAIASVPNGLYVAMPSPSGGTGYATHPLGSGFGGRSFDVSPDGSVLLTVEVSRDDFRLLSISVDGDTLRDRRIPFESRSIGRRDREWLTDRFGRMVAGEYMSGSGFSRTQATIERERQRAMEAIRFPDDFPPVRRILAGTDDSVWLLRGMRLPELEDRWEVYSRDGELEGRILVTTGRSSPLPWAERLQILQASRNEVWGVTLGDFDEPYVLRYRVVPAC